MDHETLEMTILESNKMPLKGPVFHPLDSMSWHSRHYAFDSRNAPCVVGAPRAPPSVVASLAGS